jgi:hypothetical protein
MSKQEGAADSESLRKPTFRLRPELQRRDRKRTSAYAMQSLAPADQ